MHAQAYVSCHCRARFQDLVDLAYSRITHHPASEKDKCQARTYNIPLPHDSVSQFPSLWRPQVADNLRYQLRYQLIIMHASTQERLSIVYCRYLPSTPSTHPSLAVVLLILQIQPILRFRPQTVASTSPLDSIDQTMRHRRPLSVNVVYHAFSTRYEGTCRQTRREAEYSCLPFREDFDRVGRGNGRKAGQAGKR